MVYSIKLLSRKILSMILLGTVFDCEIVRNIVCHRQRYGDVVRESALRTAAKQICNFMQILQQK